MCGEGDGRRVHHKNKKNGQLNVFTLTVDTHVIAYVFMTGQLNATFIAVIAVIKDATDG